VVRNGYPSGIRNVALVGGDQARWSGGNDFLRLLAGGLWQISGNSQVRFSLLLTEDTKLEAIRRRLYPWKRATVDLLRLQKPAFPRSPSLQRKQVIDAVGCFGGALNTIVYRERRDSFERLNQILARHNFDVALPITSASGHVGVPWVGHLPDMQHKHYPEFFSREEYLSREAQFRSLLQKAKAVIVNSRNAKADIDEAFPGHQCAIFNLPFAPLLNPAWLEREAGTPLARYNLPGRYFLISNQFWIHKSHATAFEALAQLSSAYNDVSIVCTGNTSDYRHPDYFRRLQDRIVALKIQNRVRILGLVPKSDQIQIMRAAVAVIQPTLFEGTPGGISVYDAVSIGTPVILSDIAINREVKDDKACIQFFERSNAEALAEKMRMALGSPWRQPSNDELRTQSHRRAEALGIRILEACEFAREQMAAMSG
jgi:glycosyltransferase involved in cell wall biosynthesis